ncbi:MAG: hypothetical protein CEN89_611 [Candidatus Berkelbacteria bacterium Licking1014_7]|uniref:Uncharacterized protein n=1 Tax=Candidatus Berkelbacteria bacterium Licking1014_7 TaxID=2017147 RepID=A0A554LIV2_9BACT|nr:MAG: hypothetical protein CEN89_611 [Candidatus Berkelbacteria bacterium Licking1014_7]
MGIEQGYDNMSYREKSIASEKAWAQRREENQTLLQKHQAEKDSEIKAFQEERKVIKERPINTRQDKVDPIKKMAERMGLKISKIEQSKLIADTVDVYCEGSADQVDNLVSEVRKELGI